MLQGLGWGYLGELLFCLQVTYRQSSCIAEKVWLFREGMIIFILRKIVPFLLNKSIKLCLFGSSNMCRGLFVNREGSRWTVPIIKPLSPSSEPVFCTPLWYWSWLCNYISPLPPGSLLGSACRERLESKRKEKGLNFFLIAYSSLFAPWLQRPYYLVVSHRILLL